MIEDTLMVIYKTLSDKLNLIETKWEEEKTTNLVKGKAKDLIEDFQVMIENIYSKTELNKLKGKENLNYLYEESLKILIKQGSVEDYWTLETLLPYLNTTDGVDLTTRENILATFKDLFDSLKEEISIVLSYRGNDDDLLDIRDNLSSILGYFSYGNIEITEFLNSIRDFLGFLPVQEDLT